jgi:hypothetical protein
MRVVRIIARVLFVLTMTAAIMMLAAQYLFIVTAGSFDSIIFPTKAGMEAHADRLASHFAHRLAEIPVPLIEEKLDSVLTRNNVGSSFYPPYLTTADLPQRFEVRWSSVDGWLSDTPQVHRDRYQKVFDVMAQHGVDDEFESSSQFAILLSNPGQPDSTTLAGQWTFTDPEISFAGALTPGFYEYYAPRWFIEYNWYTVNQYLDNYFWRPAEFRFAFSDSSFAPIVLRPGQTVDMVEVMINSGDMPEDEGEAKNFTEGMRFLTGEMNGEPGWQEDAEWHEAWLAGKVDVQVASPNMMDKKFVEMAKVANRWSIGTILLGLVLGIVGWVPTRR